MKVRCTLALCLAALTWTVNAQDFRATIRGQVTDEIKSATEALTVFQRYCGTSDDDVIADLICDLDTWLTNGARFPQ